ncbi:unnamed protein product [Adineta steineri]|uniref:Kazal-like domain-containing protein n=1 Tax=Adineta steineri TaxID=433720 RepID=A0A814DBC8_9BILA|nr:unnamed protein product [Adineta steineri]CAF0960974.1 unnamed protein product [Adineta steineri]
MSDNNDTEIINPNETRKRSFWTIQWYLLFLCLIVLCQSMITSGYIGSIISSIENYYGFSTEDIGIAFSSYDIIGVFSVPLISYFGSKYNRAKIVALGALIFSFGNILFILPYLINGYHEQINPNSSNQSSDYFCSQNISINKNEHLFFHLLSISSLISNYLNYLINIINQPSWTYYIIILSMIIMSIGASPFYTLGITFLTDHLNKNDQPIYTSILYGMVALGPAIGFSMGSLFISQWINIVDETNHDGITKNDPRWIGHIFNNILNLFKNVTYILIVLINSIESILVVSFTTYMVKYIESVFNISSSLSSILTGSIVVPAAICGTITGGFLVRRFNLNIFGCIKFILICCFISLISLISLIFIKCDTNIKYEGNNQCSQSCNCSQYIYQPVCYQQQQITYLSPCYAGCTDVNGTEYLNCKCLLSIDDKVTSGLCENVCLLKSCLFFLILFLVTYFETLMATPQLMIVLRSVKHDMQSFGLGLENCIMKILAQIPTPIIFGIIIDNQCLFWSQSSTYNKRGSCFIYNQNQLPLTLFGTAIIIKIISFILILILYFITFKRKNIHLTSDEQQDLLDNSHS